MRRRVKDLIQQRGLGLSAIIAPHATVFDALSQMAAQGSGALMVVENHQLRGILSETDFARANIRQVVDLSDQVTSIMSTKIFYAEPDFTLEDCLRIMLKAQVRHLPVLDGDRPIAFLSIKHIMEILVEEKEAQIRQLTTYITGLPPELDSAPGGKESQLKMPVYQSTLREAL